MRTLLLLLVITTACKKSDDSTRSDEPAKPTTVETSPAPVRTEPPDTAPSNAPTAGSPAKLALGETHQGCIGWSATKKAAACILGEDSDQVHEAYLVYVGTERPRTSLAESIDENTAKRENETLAKDGYVAFTDKPVDVAQGTKTAAGGSLSITWTLKQTKEGGNNVAPSYSGDVILTCGGKDETLYHQLDEEGLEFAVTLRKLGTHALVEMKLERAREGEFRRTTRVFLMDTASCTFLIEE